MKGSAVMGPVGKEAAELWPVSLPWAAGIDANRGQRIASNCGVVV